MLTGGTEPASATAAETDTPRSRHCQITRTKTEGTRTDLRQKRVVAGRIHLTRPERTKKDAMPTTISNPVEPSLVIPEPVWREWRMDRADAVDHLAKVQTKSDIP